MYYFKNDSAIDINIGSAGEGRLLFVDDIGLRTTYFRESGTYVIQRVNAQVLDGYVDFNRVVYGNVEVKNSLEELLEFLVSGYYMRQDKREVLPFVEFDYLITEDHMQIIVYPVYIDKDSGVVFDGPYIAERKLKDAHIMVSMGTRKRCRNSLNEEQKLSLSFPKIEYR